jgi:hypothetical protein
MPSTIFTLSVILLLIVPGVVFAIQVENRLPNRELSSLRELATIVGVGALCDFIVLVLFGLCRAILPRHTPNVGAIVNSGMPYVRLHYTNIGWWSAGLLAVSCGLAYGLGRYKPEIAGRIAAGKIRFTSAWWELFNMYPDSLVYVGCELQDGSYIAGFLLRYSTEVEETPNRELALSAPISYRPTEETHLSVLEDVGAVSISAGQVKFLTVTYLDELSFNNDLAELNSVPASANSTKSSNA